MAEVSAERTLLRILFGDVAWLPDMLVESELFLSLEG